MRKLYLLALLLIVPVPAQAQDGAFDMGGLGMNGAIDQATRQARGQAGVRAAPSPKGAARWKHKRRIGRHAMASAPRSQRATCANARRMSGKAGTDPRMPQLVALCNRAGY